MTAVRKKPVRVCLGEASVYRLICVAVFRERNGSESGERRKKSEEDPGSLGGLAMMWVTQQELGLVLLRTRGWACGQVDPKKLCGKKVWPCESCLS